MNGSFIVALYIVVHSLIEFFSYDCDSLRDELSKRHLYNPGMERRYQGIWSKSILADYCRCLVFYYTRYDQLVGIIAPQIENGSSPIISDTFVVLRNIQLTVVRDFVYLTLDVEKCDIEGAAKQPKKVKGSLFTESVEADVVTSEEYQEKCSRFIKRINRVLRKEKTSNKKLDESRVKPQNSVKLPKLVLEKYSGDPKKFTEFWNSYESTIDKNESLNKVEKFAYLKTLLIGAASNVVASLELNEKNYDECIKTLKERFGKKDIIVSQFMNKLLNLESVKSASNVKALRRLYDEIEIAVRNLEAQGVTKGSFGQLLIPVLLKSIPEEFVLEFNRKKKSKDEICVSDLLDFIKNEIECRESTYLLCQEKKVTLPPRFEHAKFDNKKFSRNVPTAASFNAVDSRTCIFCDKYHNSVSCDKSVSEKLYKLRNDNRCYVCFRKFHVGRNCRYKSNCPKCGLKSHHESVCTNNYNRNKTRAVSSQDKNESSENAQETSEDEKQNSPNEKTISVTPCNYISCKKNTLLQTCSVLAYCNDKTEVTNLILDCGTTRSFIHVSLAKKLNLKIVREERLSVFSFGMNEASPHSYPVVEFFISDKKKENKIKVCCLVTDVITAAPLTTPSSSTNKQMKKLGLLAAESCSGLTEVGILIDVDYFWQIVKGSNVQLGRELLKP
ncbi:hypothetical protein AVEN_88549-1 [Araneus ventricosus]|uniref:Peptidase aspartic putative domain-containing protein n=1 Tax=Araneus ventricosus TaxID=182803 RepID=A0A4Y2RBT4_ARAVE|nr:hypothetical protein AVEN_88549-1 [Araneus ventricosus]